MEQWKAVPWAPNYQVSDMGNVRSKAKPKGLKFSQTIGGYLRVGIGSRHWIVNRLILTVFVGPRTKEMHAAHLNGNRKDNRLTNLEWVDAKTNAAHNKIHGTQCRGIAIGQSKLTEADVKEIRRRFVRINPNNSNAKILAKEFSISSDQVRKIVHRKWWKHI